MVAEDLITGMVPPLKLSDTGEKAKHWMEELRLRSLPVVDKNKFLGFLTEHVLLESTSLKESIESYRLENEEVHVWPGTHYYDVIKLGVRNGLELVPVLDEDQVYAGVVLMSDAANAIASQFADQSSGGILLLHMKEQDYSMAQISRLIESNDCKILSSFLINDPKDTNHVHLTLKLNRSDLTRVIATLERFGYIVEKQYQEAQQDQDDQERLDMLIKYLNM